MVVRDKEVIRDRKVGSGREWWELVEKVASGREEREGRKWCRVRNGRNEWEWVARGALCADQAC